MANKKKAKQSVQPCPCTIDKFELTCSHGRKANSSGFLQIVADPTNKKSESHEFGPPGSTLSLQCDIDYGGKDSVSVKLISGSGCQDKIKISGPGQSAKWVNGKSLKGEFEVTPFYKQKEAEPYLKFSYVSPAIYSIVGNTIAGSKYGRIQQFPSDVIKYSGKVDALGHIAKSFNESWEKWGETAFGWSPITITPKIATPAGSFSASTCYKEEKDSCYVVRETTFEAGLEPLFGISIEVNVSLMVCLGASVGVPPPVAKLMSKHLADIILGSSLGVNSKVVGSFTSTINQYTNAEAKSGKVGVGIEGFFAVSLTARIGSDYVLSASIKGETKITIANDNDINVNSDAITFQPEVNLKPMEVSVTVKMTAFVIYTRNKSKNWKLWKEDKNIWKASKRTLIDFSNSSN